MAKISFDNLWASHPTIHRGETQPCRRKDGTVAPWYENQCAMAFGEGWVNAGGNFHGFSGSFCGSHGSKHPRGAEDVANFLKRTSREFGFKKVAVFKNATPEQFKDKRGIIFFRNFWGRNNQGDHIDLWNGTTLAKSGVGGFGFFARSQEVWFWEEEK